jgi:hypothetical protein
MSPVRENVYTQTASISSRPDDLMTGHRLQTGTEIVLDVIVSGLAVGPTLVSNEYSESSPVI